jgi:hypothetical protein
VFRLVLSNLGERGRHISSMTTQTPKAGWRRSNTPVRKRKRLSRPRRRRRSRSR